MTHRFNLSPEAVEGGSTPNPTPATEDKGKAPDLAKAVESLIAKHGDGTAALRVLLAENYQHREDARKLRERLPADGSLVLTGDDAKAWDRYRGLGKPEDLSKVKAEHGTYATELASLKRSDELRSVAEKAGVKFAVLRTLAGSLDFNHAVKVKDAKTNKETEVLAVKDGESDPVAFDDYAAKNWADFLPALKVDAKVEEKSIVPPRRSSAPLPNVEVKTTNNRPRISF